MLGPKETSTLRLNISQTFYPLGSILGILLGKYLVFTDGDALHLQMESMSETEKTSFAQEMLQRTLQPYQFIIMILVVLLIVVALTQMPTCKPLADSTHVAKAKIGETLAYLASNWKFLRGILVQFLYVGMQTAVWSFTIRLALNLDDQLNERSASTFMIWAFVAFFLGKFFANIFMTKIDENLVLVLYAILGSISLVYVMLVPNISAVYAAVLVSGLFGPCWATIYSHCLDAIEDKRHTETGGAVVPLIQGYVSDTTGSLQISFVVSLVCFIAVLFYFVTLWREGKQAVSHNTKQVQSHV